MEQTKQRATEIDKAVSNITTGLVLLLAVIAFVLSYNALRAVAVDNGIPDKLAYIWPLLVDFALVVFSLAILRASLLNERTFWYWVMVICFAIATVCFNIVHAPSNILARIVAVVPPVALLLSFETLMSMVRSNVRRSAVAKPKPKQAATTEPKPAQPKKVVAKQADAKERIAQLIESNPALTGPQLAKQAGISEQYARRIKKSLLTAQPVNGTGAQQ